MIREAKPEDVRQVADMVKKYREFYGVENQVDEEVTSFMRERLKNGQSKVFVAMTAEGEMTGFVQLYPSYSTVSLRPQWILNDFYVEEKYRRQGYGNALLEYVKEYFKDSSKGFILVTDKHNTLAKSVYDRNGWKTGEYDFYTWYY